MTRVAIIGARAHRALAQVWRRVRERAPEGIHVVSGGADGVDTVAELAARQCGLGATVHHAQWQRDDGSTDRGAGMRRNSDIVADCDEVEAFPWPGCRGTWDTIRKAQAAGKPVRIHEPDETRQALLVFSARVSYAGPGRLQITRRGDSCDPMGLPFAPSEQLLDLAVAARGQAEALRFEARELREHQMVIGETRVDVGELEMRATALDAEAAQIEAASFAWFRVRFLAEMRVSCGLARGTSAWGRQPPEARALAEEAWERGARPHPEAWRRLLAAPMRVLCCFCTSALCHRTILRAEILPALGAVDGGEVAWR